MPSSTAELIRSYYAAFNAEDESALLDLLTTDVAHDVNQGGRDTGKAAFARFLSHMHDCYRERIADLVVMTEPAGLRAAAEFTVHGTYLKTDSGQPAASGQSYTLAAGAFFAVRDGKIARVSTYYNLEAWRTQVSAAA